MKKAIKKITLVVDPLPSGFSVQMTFLRSVISLLGDTYDLSVYSNYFSPSKKKELVSLGLKIQEKKGKLLSRFLKRVVFPYLNESILWSVNWFFDALEVSGDSHDNSDSFPVSDHIIDLSSTVMPKSDIWWVQGPPFFEVLETMASSNSIVKAAFKLFKNKIRRASLKIVTEKSRRTKKIVAVSKFIKSIYENYGIGVSDVVHSSQNFESFNPKTSPNPEKYVLTYIGKETDVETLISLAKCGINIVGFGSKIPPGMGLQRIKRYIKFLGYVPNDELIKLYTNAHFFVFPFTNEPFGVTPIESMLCGVPALTYNKEGPSETVIDGKTGWLVNSRDELILKAYNLWSMKDTGINPEDCIIRGSELRLEYQLDKLIDIMASITA